ncbi:MAG TPA: beta-ketoacyl-[acyl-carrier-protein] synthase family protein [Solirubrobacteraceae bacterium]|nr:beta-ketoacyl-[acyl-carrier-protein] synthase family protein [Solirubrobacteraceae bacterium]
MAEDSRHRVVVTGLGAITSQGNSLQDFWEGVSNGRVAIREVAHMPMDGYRTRLGGEVQEPALPEHSYLHPDGFHDRALDFTVKAAEEAMANCGVGVGPIPAERWGVVIGTCNAGLLAGEEWYRRRERGEHPDPKLVLLVPPQAFSEALSGVFGLRGPVLSVDTACAASANAIGYAAELIRNGQADAVLTGGADAFSDILYAGFNSLESLSPEPAAPYSRDRKGLSLGEGSGMLVLMREDVAREQGAPVLAEILGYGLSADGYHPTAPHPEGRGAARAIQTALAQGGVSPEEVRYVNSHGTGTPKNDPAETAATKVGLGEDAAHRAAVSSTKSMIGHLLGGAGAIEAISTVKTLEQQLAPPTASFTEPDPDCDLDYITEGPRAMAIDIAVSNNFAFGGANASIVFARAGARPQGPPAPALDRVVITGLGALTPAGTDVQALWEAYSAGRDCTSVEDGVRLGRVEYSPGDFLGPKERKRVDGLGLFSIISSRQALEDAALELDDENRTRVGAILGTGVGPMESMEGFSVGVINEGAGGANPAVFPNTVYNAAGGQVAIKIGALGPASTVTVGHAAGASSLCYGCELAGADHADAMLCLGADSLTDTVIAAYRELGVLGGSAAGRVGAGAGSNEATANGAGPGMALSEAGVAVLVERLGAACARGARIHAEVLGHAVTSDARGVGRLDPEGDGLERAMRLALERAGVSASEVAAVWASRCGLAVADQAEAKAIERLLGADVKVNAPKLLLGEPMGAGASLNAALVIAAWEHGEDVGPVLINSTSLGGTNFAIVLAPYAGSPGGGYRRSDSRLA